MANPQDLAALAALAAQKAPRPPRSRARQQASPVTVAYQDGSGKKRRGESSSAAAAALPPFPTESTMPEGQPLSVWADSLSDSFGQMVLNPDDSRRFKGMSRREFADLMRSLQQQQLRTASTLRFLEENVNDVVYIGQEAVDLARYVQREAELMRDLGAETAKLRQAREELSAAQERHLKDMEAKLKETNDAHEVALQSLRESLQSAQQQLKEAEEQRDFYMGKWQSSTQGAFLNAAQQAAYLNRDVSGFTTRGMHYLHGMVDGRLFSYSADGSRTEVNLEDPSCPDPLHPAPETSGYVDLDDAEEDVAGEDDLEPLF